MTSASYLEMLSFSQGVHCHATAPSDLRAWLYSIEVRPGGIWVTKGPLDSPEDFLPSRKSEKFPPFRETLQGP